MADYQQRADAPAIGKQAVGQGAGHTPGPWTVYSDGFVESPDRTIACVYSKSDGPIIAAAPEMLEALLGAELAVDQLCIGQHQDNACWGILRDIHAAIRKATGAA